MANVIITQFKQEGLETYQQELKNTVNETNKLSKATSTLENEELALANALTQSKQQLKDLETQGKSNTKEYKNLSNEIKASEIAIKNQGNALNSSKQKLREYQNTIIGLRVTLQEMEDAGLKGTESFKLLENQIKKLKNEAGTLKDIIGDVSAEVSQTASDTQGIDKAVRGISALAGGFTAVQGAIGLFGAENEQLEKTLLKVNSAMALSTGLQQLMNELRTKDTIFLGIQTKAQQVYNAVVGNSVGVMKLLKLAFASTGILLLIPLIATLVANFDKLKEKALQLFPQLKTLGTTFNEIKTNVINFIKTAILGFINSFSEAYNSSLLLRGAISAVGATFKTVGQGIVLIAKNISTVFSTLWSAITNPKEAISTIKKGFSTIVTNFKDFGTNAVDNFKKGIENAKKSRLDKITMEQLFPKNSGKEKGEEVGKNVVSSVKETIKKESKEPLELKAILDLQIQTGQDFERELKARIDEAKAKFKDAFNLALESGENIKDNPALKAQVEQIKVLEKELEQLTGIYNSYFDDVKQTETASNEPIFDLSFERTQLFKSEYEQRLQDAKDFKEQGLITEQEYNDEINQLQQQRLATIVANAQKAQSIYGEIFNVISQGTELASQIISQNAQNEIATLEEKKKKGLISEKQYNKEVAKLKNEEAKKQRAVDISMAVAKIPMVVLQAYLSGLSIPGPQAPILAGILAGIAGAFATAQVALIAKAPLPKFRHGGSVRDVFKGSGYVKGAKHEQGGVNAELEGNEFVLNSKAVNKYGIKNLYKLNDLKLKPDVFAYPKLFRADSILNTIERNNSKELEKSINKLQNKLSEKLEYIYKGIENGNQDRYMLGKKLNKNLLDLKDSNKYV